jgi:hypothetical protein
MHSIVEQQIAKQKTGVTLAGHVSLWLREVGGAYCDACLAKELKLSGRRQANRITVALSTTKNLCRTKGVCSLCGAIKKVIEAV